MHRVFLDIFCLDRKKGPEPDMESHVGALHPTVPQAAQELLIEMQTRSRSCHRSQVSRQTPQGQNNNNNNNNPTNDEFKTRREDSLREDGLILDAIQLIVLPLDVRWQRKMPDCVQEFQDCLR